MNKNRHAVTLGCFIALLGAAALNGGPPAQAQFLQLVADTTLPHPTSVAVGDQTATFSQGVIRLVIVRVIPQPPPIRFIPNPPPIAPFYVISTWTEGVQGTLNGAPVRGFGAGLSLRPQTAAGIYSYTHTYRLIPVPPPIIPPDPIVPYSVSYETTILGNTGYGGTVVTPVPPPIIPGPS
jgi:hypothetical protein